MAPHDPSAVDVEAPVARLPSFQVSDSCAETEEGFVEFFRDVIEDDNDEDYAYMDHPDPDKRSVELEFPGSRIVKWLQFVTRGQGIPFRALIVLIVWTSFLTSMSYVAARKWDGNLPENCDSRWWCSPISIDSSIASYVGFALFLLLGFRVNDAYGRYMEGVRNDDIAGVVSAFCTFAGLAFKRGIFHKNDRERIFGLTAAYAVSLKRALRDERDLRELKGMLSSRDLAAIQAAPDMPGYCIYILNAYLMQACHKDLPRLPDTFLTMLMGHTQQMAAYQGQCMRIRNYKVAWGYIGHLRIFLVLWFALLPLSLVETSGWFTILWVPLIAYGIIGMEDMARELVNPFGYQFNDIRLGQMTQAIQSDVRSIYRKSISGQLVTPLDTPNMLQTATISQGGDLPDPPRSMKTSKST